MDWTQSPKMTLPKSPKAKESPAQKIKRLERELEDEHGTNLRKKYIAKEQEAFKSKK